MGKSPQAGEKRGAVEHSAEMIKPLTPLDPRHVRLLPGAFAQARDADAAWLLSLDPLRLLHGFYVNAGLETQGESYGGWEKASIAGHSLGHYLSACARLAAAGDARFVERVNQIVSELQRCQNARTDGFIGGMPDADRIFSELRAGDVRSLGFDLNDSWVPWYNLHKVYAGLLDAATLLEDKTALDIVTKLGDWAIEVTKDFDEALWQKMLACEFGGMNESFAQLYGLTDEKRFLTMAENFYHKAILDPLAEGRDELPGKHGNTQIPKILGCARLYELTGEAKYRTICENFWRFVTESHSYVIGGHGSREHFGPAGDLSGRLTHQTCETCNTYNMLKLTTHLFSWEQKFDYPEFFERAQVNHILASQNPADGQTCYFVPLLASDFKSYSTPDDSFWCCTGTGMENHARYADGNYFVSEDTLYVTQLVPSEAHWAEKNVTVTVEAPFPEPGDATITVHAPEPTEFTLSVRVPRWTDGMGGRRTYSKLWHGTETITLPLPRSRTVEPLLGEPSKVAFLDGPLVLAADLGPAPKLFDSDSGEAPDNAVPPAPVVVGDEAPPLMPFYSLHDRRMAVYFDTFTPEEWAEKENSYRAAEARDHDARTKTLDSFWPGQMQPERDHDFAGEGATLGERSAWKFRQAEPGGWLSFTLRALPDRALELMCKWGPPTDRDVKFSVQVEGVEIAAPELPVEKHRHIDVTYPIPEALTAGKERITVKVTGESAPFFLAQLRKRL